MFRLSLSPVISIHTSKCFILQSDTCFKNPVWMCFMMNMLFLVWKISELASWCDNFFSKFFDLYFFNIIRNIYSYSKLKLNIFQNVSAKSPMYTYMRKFCFLFTWLYILSFSTSYLPQKDYGQKKNLIVGWCTNLLRSW